MGTRYHVRCREGDVAEKVVVVGDPGRAKLASEMLNDAELVNDNRGLLTYTGKYMGESVSVATHGIGAPSAAIVIEEILGLGARKIIRVGTTGALQPDIPIGDLIIPSGAIPLDGTTKGYVPEGFCPVPDFNLMKRLHEVACERGLRTRVGLVASTDLFYVDQNTISIWSQRRVLSFEMECSVVFTLAYLRGASAAAVLVVNGNLVRGERMAKTTDAEVKALQVALDALATLNGKPPQP